MSEFKGLLMGMLIVAILYVLDRYLPKWFGAIPGIAFLLLMVYFNTNRSFNIVFRLVTVIFLTAYPSAFIVPTTTQTFFDLVMPV